jgi:hypothetical protein
LLVFSWWPILRFYGKESFVDCHKNTFLFPYKQLSSHLTCISFPTLYPFSVLSATRSTLYLRVASPPPAHMNMMEKDPSVGEGQPHYEAPCPYFGYGSAWEGCASTWDVGMSLSSSSSGVCFWKRLFHARTFARSKQGGYGTCCLYRSISILFVLQKITSCQLFHPVDMA